MTQQAVTTHKALLFHQIAKPALDGMNDPHYNVYARPTQAVTLTIHDVKQSPTGSVIGAGRVLSEADKQELRDYLNGEDGIKGEWLPENLMMLNSQKMIWYVPAKVRTMHIKTGDKVRHITLKWPSLVFKANAGRQLQVAAYAGSGRPKQNQKLYHAPLWNIYDDTRLCSGSADTTDVLDINAMKIWEEAVFETLFTHPNHDNVLPRSKTDKRQYLSFIRAKAKAGESFKVADMTPLNTTLEQWAN